MELKEFVTHGRKIICVATNYKPLLKILNTPQPKKPTIFLKPTSSYIVEGQTIQIPEDFSVNQELELGVIFSKKCKNVGECNAMDYVGGYCAALDMTATCQMKEARTNGLPWLLGKGFDTACPVSKFISKEEIEDISNQKIWCKVNGTLQQDGNTEDLIFTVPYLIAYISQYITLEPYDLLLTGSPPGMGPVKYGDVIEGGIGDAVKLSFSVE